MTTPLSPHDVELLLTRRAPTTASPAVADLRDLLDTLDHELRPTHVEPTGELAAFLGGDGPVPYIAPAPEVPIDTYRLRLLAKVASVGLGAKIALGAAAAAAALVAAGWSGALPAPVQDVVDRVLVPSHETPDSEPRPTPGPQPTQRGIVLTPDPSQDADSRRPAAPSSSADVDPPDPPATATQIAPPGPAVPGTTPTSPGSGGPGNAGGQGEDHDETGDQSDDQSDTGDDAGTDAGADDFDEPDDPDQDGQGDTEVDDPTDGGDDAEQGES